MPDSSLQRVYNETVELYRRDPRVVAAWEYGSFGKGTSDAYSDVDPVFVIRDEDFDQVEAGMRPLFERLGGRISLWWPEGINGPDLKNFAILFGPDNLVQYDMTIAKVRSVQEGFGKFMLRDCGRVEVLFDKVGLLEPLLSEPRTPYSPARLVWTIERYWVYVFIHVKYLKRNDPFKLLYAQQTLFHDHLAVLQALQPEGYWGWWPWSVKNLLDHAQQEELLAYFGPPHSPAVTAALWREIDCFGRDARRACAAWGLAYPEAVEADIRAHLARHCPPPG